MGRIAVTGMLAVVLAGCASGGDMATKQELQGAEDRLSARIAESAAAAQGKISEAMGKYPDIVAAEKKVANAMEDLEKLRKRVEEGMQLTERLVRESRADMLEILEAEEKLLTDRLMSLRGVIEKLRKEAVPPAERPAAGEGGGK